MSYGWFDQDLDASAWFDGENRNVLKPAAWFDPLLAAASAAPSFLTFDFNEAASTTLASIDARFNVTGTLTTTGTGALQTTAFGVPVAFFAAAQGDSQKSEVVARPHALANSVVVYLQRTATQGGYKVWHSSTTAIQIRRNGVFATTLTVSAFDYSVNPLTLRAEYNASTGVVTVFRNGTQVGTWTDGTPLTGGSPGFGIEDNDAGAGDVLIESWTDRQTAGATGISGTSALTLGAMTQAAAGAVSVAGASSQTLGAVTGSAPGTVLVSGASSQALGPVTQAAAGTVAVVGSSSQTLGAVTQSAAGTVGASPITGTSSLTLGSISGAAAGTAAIAGASAQTLGAVTQTAAGTIVSGTVGTSSVTLGAVTGAAAGLVAVAGASAQAIGSITQAAAGSVRVQGVASSTIGAVSQVATGTAGFPAITGASSVTLGATASGAAGRVNVTGQMSAQLTAVLSSASGIVTGFIDGPSDSDLYRQRAAAAVGLLGIHGSGDAVAIAIARRRLTR